jgi:hypothetical protein
VLCANLRKQKRNKKGQQRYISRICGGGIPKDGELKLGAFVELVDVINHTNFLSLSDKLFSG